MRSMADSYKTKQHTITRFYRHRFRFLDKTQFPESEFNPTDLEQYLMRKLASIPPFVDQKQNLSGLSSDFNLTSEILEIPCVRELCYNTNFLKCHTCQPPTILPYNVG